MKIKRAFSVNPNEQKATTEIYSQIYQENIGVVLLFCSSNYNPQKLAQEIKNTFGNILVFACTTAGEIGSNGYIKNGITAVSISANSASFSLVGIPNISEFDIEKSDKIVAAIKEKYANFSITPNKFVGLLLIDGLSKLEDKFIFNLSKSFYPMEIIGGSSGDDLKMDKTYVYHDGQFLSNFASLLIIESKVSFLTFKTHHFIPTDKKLIVTEANYNERIVYELNAEKAAVEYAKMLDLTVEELNNTIFAKHPLMIKVGYDWYVRAISKVNEDLSVSFLCSLDVGTVLTLAIGKNITTDLNEKITDLKNMLGNISLIIAFDCILRRIEIESNNIEKDINDIFAKENFIGFSTYGEQCDSIHVNQTMTGIAFGL
ncbi:MAG: FIST N-terminal domain-containing protein [bacterium]